MICRKKESKCLTGFNSQIQTSSLQLPHCLDIYFWKSIDLIDIGQGIIAKEQHLHHLCVVINWVNVKSEKMGLSIRTFCFDF
jgi:hypothetical protein